MRVRRRWKRRGERWCDAQNQNQIHTGTDRQTWKNLQQAQISGCGRESENSPEAQSVRNTGETRLSNFIIFIWYFIYIQQMLSPKLWTIEHVFKYACALLFRSEPGSRTAGWSWSAKCRRCARTICCLRWFCRTCTRFSTTATTDSGFRFLLKALWCIRSRRSSTWCHIFLIITSWCRGNITTEDAFKDSLLWNT